MEGEHLVPLSIGCAAFLNAVSATDQLQNNIISAVTAFKQARNALVLYRYRGKRQRRRTHIYWAYLRPQTSWLEHILYDDEIPDEEFKKRMRVGRRTFWKLVSICQSNLSRTQTQFRACLSPQKVLAVGMYRLTHGASYQTCADTFNIGKTTVYEAFLDVVCVLNTVRNKYIKFPVSVAEKERAINTFKHRSLLPNVLGAIDVTHISIKAPKENKKDYFSRYERYDVVCQGIVTGDMKFLDIVVGFPGSMHETRVLRNTKVVNLLKKGFQEPRVKINKNCIPPFLVGDRAYPLTESIMKPFSYNTTDMAEKKFNKELSRARVAVECAFGTLKSRFKILLERNEDNIHSVKLTIIACCVLHNICIDNGDQWEETLEEKQTSNLLGKVTLHGQDLRDKLKDFVDKTLT